MAKDRFKSNCLRQRIARETREEPHLNYRIAGQGKPQPIHRYFPRRRTGPRESVAEYLARGGRITRR
jgi:hypothetical protein